MATIPQHYKSSMSSISALQERCNSDEENLSAKLLSLAAAQNTSGVKVTEAIYEVIDEGFENLGKLTIKKFAAGEEGKAGDAFILTVRTKILFSGPLVEKEVEL